MRRSFVYCLILCVFLLAAPGSALGDAGDTASVQADSAAAAATESDHLDTVDESHDGADEGEAEDHDGSLSTEVADDEQDDADEEPTEEEDSVWTDEQITSDQMRNLHKKVDANDDGKVSLAEVMDFAKQARHAIVAKETGALFDEMDSDKDGKVSLDELLDNTFGAPMPEDVKLPEPDAQQAAEEERIKKEKELEKQKFKLADKNGDGFLDQDELPAAFYPETHDGVLALTAAAALKSKDKDGDGELSPAEFWENEDEDVDEATQADQKADFEKLDLDKNGKLNLDEFKAWESGHFHTSDAMNSLFEVADEDKDDELTADEVDDARQMLANSMASSQMQEWVEHYEL